jgi:predicted RND superfamily exporter protein
MILFCFVLGVIQIVLMTLLIAGQIKSPLWALCPLWVFLGAVVFMLFSALVLRAVPDKTTVNSYEPFEE